MKKPDAPAAGTPRIERKIQGWIVRVFDANMGTLTSPSGETMVMRYDRHTGISMIINESPVYHQEAGSLLSDLLRR